MKRIFYLLFLILFVSCSSSKSQNDSDTVHDTDADTQDSETFDDDSDTQADEIVDDSEETPDRDSDSEKPDSDECYPSLSQAAFPYYDKDGKITFCRPDCDTPTADDPICIGNLWDEQNDALCHEYPEYACCGTPCILESLKPKTREELLVQEPDILEFIPMHKCDLEISQANWGGLGSGVVKSWNLSDGKIGFQLYPAKLNYEPWPVANKYVTYNITTKEYSFIIPSRQQEQAYYKGKRLALVSDKRNYNFDNENIFLAYIGDDAKVEIVYDKKVQSISYEPALNEKWAFVNLVEAGSKRMMYAKVGEWKWSSLGKGLGWFPSLVGDTLSFVDDNVNGWICDLSKKPQKLEDCLKFNQEGEQTEYLYFDKENEKRFVYYDTFKRKIVLVERNGDKFERKDLITEFTEESAPKAYSLLPRTLRGNIFLYEEVTTNGAASGGRLCYYRIDKNKKYCMKKMEDDKTYSDGSTVFPYGFAEFEGKWLLYQKRNSDPFILRDMECYCKEEGVCPFE